MKGQDQEILRKICFRNINRASSQPHTIQINNPDSDGDGAGDESYRTRHLNLSTKVQTFFSWMNIGLKQQTMIQKFSSPLKNIGCLEGDRELK